jgi:hypothetical protein
MLLLLQLLMAQALLLNVATAYAAKAGQAITVAIAAAHPCILETALQSCSLLAAL